jgi:hypothetical protein
VLQQHGGKESSTSGRIADHYGRLYAMRLAAILFVVSAIGSGVANSLFVLALFRIVGGVAVGIASVIAPAYIAEIAPAEIRGPLSSLQQLAILARCVRIKVSRNTSVSDISVPTGLSICILRTRLHLSGPEARGSAVHTG